MLVHFSMSGKISIRRYNNFCLVQTIKVEFFNSSTCSLGSNMFYSVDMKPFNLDRDIK